MLRYQDNDELHRDFHGTTNTTLDYIAEQYGVDALKEILRRTGREVYKTIREKLARGDASELLEHLVWFHYREGGEFSLSVSDDEIRFEVKRCPAWSHIEKMELKHSPHFCLQSSELYAGICEGTGWECTVKCTGSGKCVQTFRKAVKNDSK